MLHNSSRPVTNWTHFKYATASHFGIWFLIFSWKTDLLTNSPSQHFLLLLEGWWHRFSLNCLTIYQSLYVDDPMWMHFKCEEEETITTAYIYHAYMQICKYIYLYATCTSVKTCPRDCAVTCISKSLSAVISLFTVLSFIFHNFEKYSQILLLPCWTYFKLAEMLNANHNVTMHNAQCTVHIARLQPFSYTTISISCSWWTSQWPMQIYTF